MRWKVALAGLLVISCGIGVYFAVSTHQTTGILAFDEQKSDVVIKDFPIQETFTDKKVEIQIKEAKEYYLEKITSQLYPVKEKVVEEYTYQGRNFETPMELTWPFTKLVFTVTNKGNEPLYAFSEKDKQDYNDKKDKLEWIPLSYLLSDKESPAPVQYYKQFFPLHSYIDKQGLLPGQTVEIHAYYLFPPLSLQLALILPTLRWGENGTPFTIQAPFNLTGHSTISRQHITDTIQDIQKGGL